MEKTQGVGPGVIHEEITRKIRVILARFTYRAFLALNFLSLITEIVFVLPCTERQGPFLGDLYDLFQGRRMARQLKKKKKKTLLPIKRKEFLKIFNMQELPYVRVTCPEPHQ